MQDKPSASRSTCSIEGCDRRAYAKATGWCHHHHHRWLRHGDPLGESLCSVEGCERPVRCNGLCNAHNHRWRRLGDPGDARVQQKFRGRAKPACSVEGCERDAAARGVCKAHYYEHWKARRPACSIDDCEIPANSKGLCPRHYQRLRKHGHPLAGPAFRAHRGTGLPDWVRHQRRDEQELAADPDLLAYVDILRGDPCSYCGAPCEHIDHIEPFAAGGALVVENVTASCMRCNVRKNQTPLLLWLALR